ncbi:tyrosine-type recombinase/integrase [Gaoshiqia sediminis]|uniref:Tyrosine-type recombinase/integrase n=1 Tax=Gaoshiqia sediminis TaxID=2986998 RepID=A0AA42CAX8_9BACT|nr:tyrosine-type recombinase/integrase [Gaoshiqia sediminis]MCW0484442.1 tyrosine-type recombinase/integrase [Gaoshiqia sediminis]
MNKIFEYTSIFAPFINDFIHGKELQGYKATQLKWMLLEFDKFFTQTFKKDLFISSGDVKNWVGTRTCDKPNTLYQKYCAMADFCRYMCLLGYECYIPRRPRKCFANYTPTIFTHDQMRTIFNVCDNLAMKEHHAKSIMIIMPALIRVLYSTGIRISEALSILNKDVDFDRKVIVLNNTKNRCQRLAPVNETLEQVLRQYISYRNRIPTPGVANPDSHLFVSATGRPCSRRTVLTYFHRIIEECEIPRRCDQRGPMVHEIRHSTAVHSLIKLTRDGVDLYCSLPLLATFMGHRKVLDTETYVRLTQEMYPEVLKMNAEVTDQVYSFIISKLKQDYENRCD